MFPTLHTLKTLSATGWIRSVDRQALHRPHGSLAVLLKYKKKIEEIYAME